jgi:outer membrane protein assembly factor BamB
MHAFYLRLSVFICGYFLWPGLAQAVVTRLTPLREALQGHELIFTVKVEKLDPDKPSAVLQVVEDLKGKASFKSLPIKLTADSYGQREKHTAKLLKRLAVDLPLVVFASARERRYTAFAYTNGTWFQIIGHRGDDGAVRWSFTHCEPYLRRTFKGTTAELEQVIRDGLAGKKAPPEPNENEPPGLGPEIENAKIQKPNSQSQAQFRGHSGQLFAVIPTFVILGPVALLATLFPVVFGGLALLMRRWLVLLSIASLDSTLYLAHAWLRGYLKGSWWGTMVALWSTLTVVSLLGVIWSWRRNRALAQLTVHPGATPARSEQVILWMVSLTGLVVVIFCLFKGTLLLPPWKESLAIWSVAWVGTIYTLGMRWLAARRPATEGIMLWALVIACAGLGFTSLPRDINENVKVLWTFEPAAQGAMISSPRIDGDRVYIAAVHSAGFSNYGAVYCLNRCGGQELWKFDNDGQMLQVFSSPCLAEGRLFIGEGLHENQGCKFFCLDAHTGKKLWEFETASHVESSPCVRDGKVFFGAGDDGIYCLDAATGKECWHFAQALHVDASPIVVGNRLFCGSGTSRAYKTTEVFCLNTADGQVEWRRPTDLPVWGSPIADGSQVFFGVGNGRFDQSAQPPIEPAGAVLCVEAATGELLWQAKARDAVLVKPAVDQEHVYFAARDHHCYCVDRQRGHVLWEQDLGSPIVAAPALLEERLYLVASAGRVCCLERRTGQLLWSFDTADYTQARPQLLSSPAVHSEPGEGKHLIYFGAELKNAIRSAAALFCVRASCPAP